MRLLTRLVVAAAVLGGFFYLFLRVAHQERQVPYTVERRDLARWTLALGTGGTPSSPLLVLSPASELHEALFSQVFRRMMESMKGATGGGVPIVLRAEYEASLGATYTPQELLAAARAAGIESSPMTPACMGLRRISEPGRTRQVYFAVFDAPAIVAFREQLARTAQILPGSRPLEASALSPVLLIGGADQDFDWWWPIRVRPEGDCVAPIQVDDAR